MSSLNGEFLIGLGKRTHLCALIGTLEHTGNSNGARVIRCQSLRIKRDAELPALASDQGGYRNILHLLGALFNFRGDPAQGESIIILSPESERQDGYVVNRTGLNERPRSSLRNRVQIGVELVVRQNNSFFFFNAHIES